MCIVLNHNTLCVLKPKRMSPSFFKKCLFPQLSWRCFFTPIQLISNTTNTKKMMKNGEACPLKTIRHIRNIRCFFSVPTAQPLTPNSRMINTGILIFSVLIVALSLTFFNIILEFVTYVPLFQKCNMGTSYCINFVTCSHNLPITLQHKKQKFENNHSHFY